jgi:hypothetical protein
VALEQGSLGALQLFAIAGGEDEADRTLGETRCDGKAETARAAGDEDHGSLWDGLPAQGTNGEGREGDGRGSADQSGSCGCAADGCSGQEGWFS